MAYYNSNNIQSADDLMGAMIYLEDQIHPHHKNLVTTPLRSFQNLSSGKFIAITRAQLNHRNKIQNPKKYHVCLAEWGLIRMPAESFLAEDEINAFHRLAASDFWRNRLLIFNEHVRKDGCTELNYIAGKFGGRSGTISFRARNKNQLYVKRVKIAKLISEINTARRQSNRPEIPLNPDQRYALAHRDDEKLSDLDIWNLLRLMTPKSLQHLKKSTKIESIKLNKVELLVDENGHQIRNPLIDLIRLKEDLFFAAKQKLKLQDIRNNITSNKNVTRDNIYENWI
jgi:hypothetical protein